MIAIAGGTGRLGSCLVRLLVAEGRPVRVLTRARERARDLPPEVVVVISDVRKPAELARAVAGCEALVSAIHGFVGADGESPESIDARGNSALIAAALAASVKRFVLLSVTGASPQHPMSLHRAKYSAEQELRHSGLGFTIIRCAPFLETWVDVIGEKLASVGQALVLGRGQNPINFVSVRDVATLVALSLVGEGLPGELLELGGVEELAFNAFAEQLIAASGKPGQIKRVPLPALRLMSVLARPFSPGFARKARAAVVMDTSDMTLHSALRERFPTLPNTRLQDLLQPKG